MGRETTARVSWHGQTSEAKVLLERTELILRGGVKARIARGSIAKVTAATDGLHLVIDGAVLHVAMGEVEAVRWAKAIATPPPSLAAKLGVATDRLAYVLGDASDLPLAEALAGARAPAPDQAAMLLAVIEDAAGLAEALGLAKDHPALPIWCIYPKGKAANPGDGAIRAAFRGAGWMDNKTSAVSDRLTATRYALKR